METHPLHEALESGRGSEQAEWKCDKLEQTVRSGEDRLFLGLGWLNPVL